ncbi:MAG TPA: glycosyltransferase family 2 protein, partial [Thermoanaerobaculia bacterium]|nr:glycosyltransferase family 2 protein [Thermoanaerobaculia bacterium]
MIAAKIVFWACFAVCLYIYFGYPALLWIISRFRSRPVREADVHPRATFIIPAYNEERTIGRKIENTLSLDYPADRIEVLVVSNGSTDRTNEIVSGWSDPRVRLIALPQPGKMAALNEGARAATGEVLIFTDADFYLDQHSLRVIARKFADPEVGGVCGARRAAPRPAGESTGEGEGMYHRWDKWQKIRESRIGSVFAADGLLYAIRRELYVPVSLAAQADDIAISTRVPLQGYRLLFEPEATAWEEATISAREEFGRKIRVTNHSVRALFAIGAPLVTSGFYSVELLSHKLVRHFIPLFLVPMFFANLILVREGPFYALTMAGQLLIYALAAIGAVLRERPIGRSRVLTVPYYFCFVNAAALLGIFAIFRGRKLDAWSTRGEPLSRPELGAPLSSPALPAARAGEDTGA